MDSYMYKPTPAVAEQTGASVRFFQQGLPKFHLVVPNGKANEIEQFAQLLCSRGL